MHFQVKMLEKGRKYIFKDKETTNKVALFFDSKLLKER